MIRIRPSLGLALAGAAALVVAGCSSGPPPVHVTPWPATSLHYTPNGNFGQTGQYLPRTDGFNLADVKVYQKSYLAYLPAGVKALVYLQDCGGATGSFQNQVKPFIGSSQVWGFYLMDEPDPKSCPAAHLKAESDWIHANDPGAKTFIVEQNLSASYHPRYAGDYTPGNSNIDYYGLDPYPCRNDTYPVTLNGCNYRYITMAVTAAEKVGIPQADIVPVYQAFGGGNYPDDGGGGYILPTAAQEQQLLADWAALVPHPKFDYTYSWGPQEGDNALSQSPALRAVFTSKNK
jgi:hypothetical protein